jgi:hypothetical protein
MTTRFMNSIKSVFVFCMLLFSVIACEKDFEDVGISLIDNSLFNTESIEIDIISYNVNVDSSRVDNLPLYNLGIYNDPNFGTLYASVAAQVGISTVIDFGLNPVIDTVVLDIPYYSTREAEDNDDGSANYTLDSILGNQEAEFTLKVSRLTTFLNALDPNDLTRNKEYYSDENYATSTELYSGLFKPNKNDTVLYVNRSLFEGQESIDTIKKDDLSPSIKLPLDKAQIENIFFSEATETNLSSFENFVNFFRGILLEAEGTDGSLMSLLTVNSSFVIYYTNEVLTDETTVDLNGDGDTDDLQVPVKTKRTLTLSMLGIETGVYSRNYAGANIESFLNTPNKIEGEEKLFIQGSAGSNAELDIQIDLEDLRSKNWLINGGILDLYVEDSEDNRNVPEQLYLYNADNNSVITDVLTESSIAGIAGFLERDEDTNLPIRYRFVITDYLSELLEPDNSEDIYTFRLKTYHPTDAPVSIIDTIVKNFSWRSRGVVLKGNKLPLTDEERLKLTIYYTEDNN